MKSWWHRVRGSANESIRANARLSYPDYLRKLLARHDAERAMSDAVGGDYERMGDALRERLWRLACGLTIT